MADRYWVGGTNTLDSTSTGKWSTTKGGASGAAVPGLSDNIYITDAPATYWAATTAYSLTNYRCPTTPNGYAYECTTAGTSGGTEPTWPTTVGNTVNDGTVVWTCRSVTITLVSTTRTCLNLNFTGFIGTFAGSNTEINIYGDFTRSAEMTWSGPRIDLVKSSGTQYCTTNGGAIGALYKTSGAGTVVLQDDVNCGSATFQVADGSGGLFNTNGKTVTCGAVTYSYGNLTLGASIINCTSWNCTSSGTLTAGTSSIRVTGTGSFIGNGKTYYEAQLNGTAHPVSGANTFTNLIRTGTATKTDSLTLSDNQTVTGTLTLTGNSATNRLYVASDVRGTTRTITAAAVSITNVDFEDIAGAGAASPFTGTSLGNCYGNSGITFTTAVTRYHVASSSSNSSYTDNLWSTTSGGATGASIPLPQDTAIFDANSGGGTNNTITLDMPRMASIMSSVSKKFLAGVNPCYVYGNFENGTHTANDGNYTFGVRGRGTHTLKGSTPNLQIEAVTGTYACNGDLDVRGSNALSPYQRLKVVSGTFDGNGYAVSCGIFNSTGTETRTVNMGSGNWTLRYSQTPAASAWLVDSTGLTFDKGSASITLTGTGTGERTFGGGGLTYNDLIIGGSTGVSSLLVTGSNTFGTISSTKTVAHTIKFTAGTTTTVADFAVDGTSGNLVTITSATAAAHTLVKSGGGTIDVAYANISYSTASPASTWNASNSTDSGNNSGWSFNTPVPSGNLFFGSNF